jgi:hypothetical protein
VRGLAEQSRQRSDQRPKGWGGKQQSEGETSASENPRKSPNGTLSATGFFSDAEKGFLDLDGRSQSV